MAPSPESKKPEISSGKSPYDIPKNTLSINNDQNEVMNVPNVKKSTIFGTTSMITNIYLGETIISFAVRAKSFGLFWLLFSVL